MYRFENVSDDGVTKVLIETSEITLDGLTEVFESLIKSSGFVVDGKHCEWVYNDFEDDPDKRLDDYIGEFENHISQNEIEPSKKNRIDIDFSKKK